MIRFPRNYRRPTRMVLAIHPAKPVKRDRPKTVLFGECLKLVHCQRTCYTRLGVNQDWFYLPCTFGEICSAEAPREMEIESFAIRLAR